MKIGLLNSNNICYDSLNYFMDCIEKALHSWGIHTQKIITIDGNMLGESWDAVIGINNTAPSMKMENGTFYLDLLGCPVFNILLDPPYHHHHLLEAHMDNLYLIVLDQGHAEYCRKYYMPFKGITMAYMLGPKGSHKNYEDKEIDVLFTGTYTDEAEARRDILQCCNAEWAEDFFELLIQIRIEHPELSALQALITLLKQGNISCSDTDIKMMMGTFGICSDYYVRGYYRKKILTSLVDAGIHVHVAGSGWEKLYSTCPENLVLEGSMNFDQTADLTANAKIVLNIMPWKDGIHDRILTAMSNGAVCVTNTSSYIDAHF